MYGRKSKWKRWETWFPIVAALVVLYLIETLRAYLRSQGVDWLEKFNEFIMRY